MEASAGSPAGRDGWGEIVNRELALKVADAVLYEGYMLYPYRPSALKNRQRWSFGILYPPAYAEVQSGTERSRMHTECLLQAATDASLLVELRFLHLIARQTYRHLDNGREAGPSLSVDGQLHESWDEGVARTTELEVAIGTGPQVFEFTFPASPNAESRKDAQGNAARSIDGIQQELGGIISVSSRQIGDKLWKLSVDVSNESEFHGDPHDRDASLLCSLLSAHIILTVKGGEFISLLDPPDGLREQTKLCANVGNFPVLIGNEGEGDMLLCSPIILYDYPQIASESAGDFYDATEIDEMLTLRVMTLSEEEKNEMRRGDDRTRDVLERTEQTAREQLARTHGIMRNPTPAEQGSSEQKTMNWSEESDNRAEESVTIFGAKVKPGDRVRLWPQKSADIMDMALKGKVAVVEAIERDFDDQIHLAVVLDDDPGRDLGMMRQPGHRFFFSLDEIEPMLLDQEPSHER